MFSKPDTLEVGEIHGIPILCPILQADESYTHLLRQYIQYKDDGLITSHNIGGDGFEYAQGIQTKMCEYQPEYPIRIALYNTYVWALRQTRNFQSAISFFGYNPLPLLWGAQQINQQQKEKRSVSFFHSYAEATAPTYFDQASIELFPTLLSPVDIQKAFLKETLTTQAYDLRPFKDLKSDTSDLSVAIIGYDIPALEHAAASVMWERLVPQGILLIDDFGAFNCRPESQKNWIAFAEARNIPFLPLPTGQMILIK